MYLRSNNTLGVGQQHDYRNPLLFVAPG